jgi:hypothetical protein
MPSIYYVYQKQTYKQEHAGGYVWSPQTAKDGSRNRGFTNMTLIKSGDYILHHKDKEILSISKVISNCYDCRRPLDYKGGEWNSDGYRIDVRYYDLNKPINVMSFSERLIPSQYAEKGNAFSKHGKPVQSYICTLEDAQAEFLLREILKHQTGRDVIDVILLALENFDNSVSFGDELDNYDNDDKVRRYWDLVSGNWNSTKKPQNIVELENTTRVIPRRDPRVSMNALKHANNECENIKDHVTFKRKGVDIAYMESHHLIPISKYKDFSYSLDIEENIVCLCPTCHRLLHHGSMEEKESLIKKLYDNRKLALEQCGLNVTFDKLKSYYK